MGGAAALLCTALTVSACGSSSSKVSSPSPGKSAGPTVDGATVVAAAFTKTTAAKTARMAISYQVTSGTATSANGLNLRGTGSGVVDFSRKIADITVNEPTGQSIEERLIGRDAYVKLPPQLTGNSPQLRGKSWLHEQLPTGTAGSLGLSSNGSQASDPTSILKLVSAVSDRVEKVGTGQVRGTPATHYLATVDFAKAAAKGGVTPSDIAAMEKFLSAKTFPVDIWIDQQGAARRLQFHFPLPKAVTAAAPGASGMMTETLDLYDFGTPVSVTPPPASEVTSAPNGSLMTSPGSGVRTG